MPIALEPSLRDDPELLAMYRLIVEQTSNMVVVTNHLKQIEWVNPAYTQVTGWTLDEIRGRTPGEFLRGPGTDGETARRVEAALARGDAISGIELLNYRKDGSEFWVSLNIQPVRNAEGRLTHYFAIQSDISERRRAEQRVRDSERRLAEAQRLAQIGSWELELDSSELTWSEEVFRIFEIDSIRFGATYGAFLERVHPDDRAQVDIAYWTSVRSKEPYEVEHRLLFPDGRIKWVIERGRTEYGADGRALRSIGTVQDVTERKRAEVALREKALAERASRAKTQFLSQMSHELRTPLNAILGFAQIMAADALHPLPESQRGRLERIDEAGRHLLALINDLLDLSRIETGTLAVSLEPVCVGDVVGEAFTLVQTQAHGRSVTISVEREHALNKVHADRTRLRQVLVNLLSNAIKYNRIGGRVTVRCSQTAPNRTTIAVSDTGLGMSAEQLERLFTPFERLGRDTAAIEGTGIGLAISKALVERMGGEITVTSEAGAGTTFCVHLAPVAAQPSATVAAADADDGDAARAVRGTVLYVEDNPINFEVLQGFLDLRPGVRLLHAANGRSGVELAQQVRPDLILIDMQLPDMHGLDVIRDLRAAAATATTTCIALSANAFPEQIAAARKAGFADYWTKPISGAGILEKIDALLRSEPPAGG